MAALCVAVGVAMVADAAPPSMTYLATFDDKEKASTWNWHDVNDPVMGGQSKATWKIMNGIGVFDGETKIVPKLKAPGFCNAETDDLVKTAPPAAKWIADSILLKVRSTMPYAGFKFSFAADTLDRQFKSYKAEFEVPADSDWHVVAIPFGNFSNDWSPFTGRCDNNPPDPNGEKHKCCSGSGSSVCPTAHGLDAITQLGFWTEGVQGKFHLEVQWIAAGSSHGIAAAAAAAKSDWTSVCAGPIQKKLLYNTSNVPSQLPGSAPDEDQADAVCCDPNFKPYAEPAGFFELPEIALFEHINATGFTTFYDSVCGKPLFRAPVGRDFKTWHAESKTHGWPSFREEEIDKENVKVDNSTGEVLSSCGTHLGSYLPDADGARYCIDLSCMAGSPLSLAPPAAAAGTDILVVDFKGTGKATTHTWVTNNDPVMGGQSYSTVKVEDGLLNFTGACKMVPSLKAPGFITAVNSDRDPWVDVSSCEGIRFNHKSATDYKGFRVSFGTKHASGGGFYARGFKADLGAPSVGAFGDAILPFRNFTDAWNDATGNPVKTCASNKIYCPDKASLANFKTMSIWAEGLKGDIQLEVNSITGYNCQ